MTTPALCTHSRSSLARLVVAGVALLVVATVMGAGGCSAPDSSARVDPVGPDAAQFAYVAPVLERRCGSIDCHGSKFRNMRVYGYGGLRLGAATSPDVPNHLTPEEVTATYESVIGLEPEIMRDVVKSGGVGPERLTFVRKGRGDEEHKGHRRVTPGDSSDRCITTWLAGSVDTAACAAGGCFDASKTPFPITQCP
jgi:hypothetical protein